MRLIILLLLAIISTACAKPSTQDDNYADYVDDDINTRTAEEDDGDDLDEYEDGDDDEMSEVTPVIKTEPQNIVARLGDDVQLPCDVVHGENFVVTWKKDDNPIVQGRFVLDTSRGIINYSNGTITIPNLRDSDKGKYMCYVMISNTDSINVTHQLSLKSAPQITVLKAKHNITQLKEGDDLELICSASGNPQPKIKWYFDTKYSNLVEEQKESVFTGERLLIENIGLERSGHYRCLADNGNASPAHASIFIEVMGKPLVRIEKIYTDNKLREIDCIVYAHPDANVHWKKDGKMLYTSGDDHNKIIFNNIKKSDIGEYTCVARNSLGEDKATVQITAVPEKPHLFLSKYTKHKDCVLGWTVHSHSPILESIISYWEKGQSHAKEVFPPKPHNTKDNTFTVSYTFSDLKRGSYEAQFKAKNEHGWSQFSNITHFEIKGPRHTKHHSLHGDTRANNGVIDGAESHTEMKDPENSQEEVLTGSQRSSGVTTIFTPELLICMAIALLRP